MGSLSWSGELLPLESAGCLVYVLPSMSALGLTLLFYTNVLKNLIWNSTHTRRLGASRGDSPCPLSPRVSFTLDGRSSLDSCPSLF